jgi:transcription elongation factor GreB
MDRSGMNKAFTRENEDEEDDGDAPEKCIALPAGSKNYMTPAGFARLKDGARPAPGP